MSRNNSKKISNVMLQSLYVFFNLFKSNLLNKKVMFVYETRDRQIRVDEMFFPKSCFLHLTGLNAIDNKGKKYNAYNFFKDMDEGTINTYNLLRKNNTTDLKFNVLSNLLKIDKTANRIGLYNENNQIFLGTRFNTSKLAGGAKGCMGFVLDKDTKVFIPNTVLDLDINKVLNETSQIVAIFKKDFLENNYAEMTHLKKNYDIAKILNNKEVLENINIRKLESKDTRISNEIINYKLKLIYTNNNEEEDER